MFKSVLDTFCGKLGYMVYQYVDNHVVSSEFIYCEDYEDFCRWIGCTPELVTKDGI